MGRDKNEDEIPLTELFSWFNKATAGSGSVPDEDMGEIRHAMRHFYAIYRESLEAGFTPDQSFAIVITILQKV